MFMLDLSIILFGGGSRRGGCSTTGCPLWMVLSVGLTILVNLSYLLFSSPAPGVDV